jgi:hypothetical protein
MRTKDAIPVEAIARLVRLDPETGRLFWKSRTIDQFEHLRPNLRLRQLARWESMFAGREAFTADHNGYRRTKVLGRNIYAHHVVFALVHGRWPDAIDHDNRDRGDNRPSNLIERSHADNMKNQAIRSNNKSGTSGVYWNARQKCWVSRVNHAGSRIYLGKFDDLDAAAAARRKAEVEYGYHPNHGK